MSESKETKKQAFKYFLFACSAGVIQFGVSTLLKAFLGRFMDPSATMWFIRETNTITFIAQTVGLCLSIIWNFTFNRKFTFKKATNVPKSMALAFLFYVPFYPFQTWYIATIEPLLLNAGIGDLISFIIAEGTCMIINLILEFCWQKFVVFKDKQ